MRRLAVSAALLLPLLLAGSAQAADPVMPLAQVRSGMDCTGLSVVRGTAISSFRVEVLDVVVGDEGGPRILVRASGPALGSGGIGFGFSGSPVICRDAAGVPRNAGAISEGLGDYGNSLVLVTPIEEMLGEPATPPPAVRHDARLLATARPLATPLAASGLAPSARRVLARAARRAGTRLLAAAAGPLGGYPVQELRPGAAAIAALAGGDVALGALGTVTYRDGASVWAFGHSFGALGRRSLFLQDAYIFAVASNPVGSADIGAVTQKLSSAAGHTVGTVTNDAPSAVVARLGAGPAAVGLSVRAREPGGRTRRLQVELADERALGHGAALALVSPLTALTAIDSVLRAPLAPMTLSSCVRFKVRQRRRRFGFCNLTFGSRAALSDLIAAAKLVERHHWTPLGLQRMAVDLRVRRGVHEIALLRAAAPRRVRPGARIRVRLRVQSPGERVDTLRLRLRVPLGLRPGRRTLSLVATPEQVDRGIWDELEQEFEDEGEEADGRPETRSLRALVERVEGLRRPPVGLRARFGGGRWRMVLRSDDVLYRGAVSVRLRVVGPRPP